MELWASGFNAWGQLEFEAGSHEKAHDFWRFKCILKDEHIEIIRTTLSAALVQTSSGLKVAGCPDELIQFFLDSADGLPHLTVAGNDKLVEVKSGTITEFASLPEFLNSKGTYLGNIGEIKQIVSNQTAFTALTETGQVYSWGDGRYEAGLGREVSDDSPASKPSLIEDLFDLPTGPIRKISSGGYVSAALTVEGDMYLWGGQPGDSKDLEQLSGTPMPVDMETDDVLDVSVGVNHKMALSNEHNLFVIGNGENGQLGLDLKEVGKWEEVSLPLPDGWRIISVHAGYKNSFVLVESLT